MGYFLSIFLGTFVLEDLALASAVGLLADGKLGFGEAFWACFLGIGLGDIVVYLVGRTAGTPGIANRFLSKHQPRIQKMRESNYLTSAILICRVIPGTRLPTYLGAGLLRYPFWKFTGLTIISVLPWVIISLLIGKSLQTIFIGHWILSTFLFLIVFLVIRDVAPKLIDRWRREALLYSWRRWLHFEFWPAWIFYLPIVPRYIQLSIRFRSLLTPFYANPNVAFGGLIGESKWVFLACLSADDPTTLPAVKINHDSNFETVSQQIESIAFPMVLKPDVGQRGFGVRIIRDQYDLREYFRQSHFVTIAQSLSQFAMEAGIFYVRHPREENGRIFSITDKHFPFVVGDGVTPLGRLIIDDRRARIVAPVYFERLRASLDSVPAKGQVVRLSECGNHCQGAIFLNGAALMSEDLCRVVDRIAKQIPDFYFGRLDVRYLDAASLKKGENFEIVEINGAGSEATHIWDARTSLLEAYRTLFEQWGILFTIGDEVRRRGEVQKIHLWKFLRECLRVIFRKEELSVSS